MPVDRLAALAAARLYLCTDSRSQRGDLADFLDAVLGAGVDVVQLREKGLEARDELRYLEVFAAAAERHGKLFAVNDRADVARAAGAPVLHLGQRDLPVHIAREIVGEETIIGRSTHDAGQADAAAREPGVDYFCVGPVWTTPTKPGRPAAGLALVEHAARAEAAARVGEAARAEQLERAEAAALVEHVGQADEAPVGDASRVGPTAPTAPLPGAGGIRPWFAIGGIDLARLDDVLTHGATRAVVVRAITEAADPAAATAALAVRLRAAAAT